MLLFNTHPGMQNSRSHPDYSRTFSIDFTILISSWNCSQSGHGEWICTVWIPTDLVLAVVLPWKERIFCGAKLHNVRPVGLWSFPIARGQPVHFHLPSLRCAQTLIQLAYSHVSAYLMAALAQNYDLWPWSSHSGALFPWRATRCSFEL